MTTRIQNLSDLQDRRIMMEKKLPAFGYALILLVAFLMVFLVIWSTQNKRTYVSQSTGSVQPAMASAASRQIIHVPSLSHMVKV